MESEKESLKVESSKSSRSCPIAAIGLAGLIAGAFDLTFAVTFYTLRGGTPIRILQSIASGLLGKDSFKGGWPTAALGVVLHFVIAFSAAAIYYLASRKLKFLLTRAPLCGILYGAVIFFVMRLVVLPLSAAPHFKFSWLGFSCDLAVHLFLIGLSIALIVRHFSDRRPIGSSQT